MNCIIEYEYQNNYLVYILDRLYAASSLYIQMAPVFPQQERVVGHHPSTVYVSVVDVVSLDPLKDWAIFWSHVLRIPICIHLSLLTERKRKLFRALSPAFGMEHAWAVGVHSTTGSMHHMLPNQFVQLRISGFIWNFTGDYTVNVICCSRFILG